MDPILLSFDNFFQYFKEIFGSLVALIGIFLTLPILRKKLTQDHITKALSIMQETNVQVLKANEELIDKYRMLPFKQAEITKKSELEEILADVRIVDSLAQGGSSDVVTILCYLKVTIQMLLINYNDSSPYAISKKEIRKVLLEVLSLANFYCTQVVQIPKSASIESKNIIDKKIKSLVTYSQYKKYKYFNQGVISDPHSAHYLMFYEKISNCDNFAIRRAAFQIFSSTVQTEKMLFSEDLYAPSKIEKPLDLRIYHVNTTLFLIGYKYSNIVSFDKKGQLEHRKVVYLIYSHDEHDKNIVENHVKKDHGLEVPSDIPFESFEEYPFEGSLFNEFRDVQFKSIGFDLKKADLVCWKGNEIITLRFDRMYLNEKFIQNKSIIKKMISPKND